MKTILSLYFILVSFCYVAAQQEDFLYPEPDKESQAYHVYRLKKTVPPYGLEKIKSIISKINFSENAEDTEDYYVEGYSAMSKKDFDELTIKEKFTYTMIHPEVNTQNCDIQLPIVEENEKIFANLPNGYDEVFWSQRQINFLMNNRNSVMNLIKESGLRSKRIGFNYKMALEEINAVELIPFLVNFYNQDKKDGDILTLLMILMKKNKYDPFIKSMSYQKLYNVGEDVFPDSYYMLHINYNKPNEELIIKRALDFYNQYNKK